MCVSLHYCECGNHKKSSGLPLPLACPPCNIAMTKNSWGKQRPLFLKSAEAKSISWWKIVIVCTSGHLLWGVTHRSVNPYQLPLWFSSKINLVTDLSSSHLPGSQQLPSLPQCQSLLLNGHLYKTDALLSSGDSARSKCDVLVESTNTEVSCVLLGAPGPLTLGKGPSTWWASRAWRMNTVKTTAHSQ